jgi:predicted nucleic acid-binding protein
LPGRAVDTNVLAYAADVRRHVDDVFKIPKAALLVGELIETDALVLPAQVLAELHNLLRRKARIDSVTASDIVNEYASAATVLPTSADNLHQAFALTAAHELQTYDAIILAAAASAGCEVLYSEDMQDGFVWNGVRVVNPFA